VLTAKIFLETATFDLSTEAVVKQDFSVF